MSPLFSSNESKIGAATLALALAACTPSTPIDTTPTPTEVIPPADEKAAVMEKSPYEAGTYAASGMYTSPAGVEEVDVSVTVDAAGTITAATFTGKTQHNTSKKLQALFSEGFTEEVVGKSIEDLSLTVVNGSSLTPKGFMDAIEKIKEEAAA